MDIDDIFTRTVREIYPDFTFRQFLVFREICQEREQKTIRGISAKFNFTGASVCRAVDRLQQMGLVVRKPDTLYARSVWVIRTKKGRDLYARIAA